jgi:drug/metabolite transporter (DMT)-like permease
LAEEHAMQTAVGIILEVVGVVLLIVGYRKSNRNLMLLAAVLLWLGSGLDDFVLGFWDGYDAGRSIGAP